LNTLSVTGFYKAVILHDILKRADEGLMKGWQRLNRDIHKVMWQLSKQKTLHSFPSE
jgi:hypothetical protein